MHLIDNEDVLQQCMSWYACMLQQTGCQLEDTFWLKRPCGPQLQ